MRIFALLLLLQTLSHEVFTLKCYKCEAMTTYPNQACLGPTVHSPMETCPEGQVCGVKAHINSFGHHQSRHVVRSCMDRINQTGCTGGHPLRTCIIQCNTGKLTDATQAVAQVKLETP
ncbi:unnamed protein product [Clavelina lepadiformis]|uniref:Uncharacterized protein n=1 Tax=Clavelina lepadiformis TaxID=159417 RepID=A0ABP0FP63_CLALP